MSSQAPLEKLAMFARLALVLLPLFLMLAPVAQADNAVVGNGTGASCNEAALDAAIAQLVPGATAPGGTITFNCGEFDVVIPVTSPKSLGFGYGAVIDASTAGATITLDAGDASQHFLITGADSRVELRGLVLLRGFASAGYGGSINVGTGTNLLLDGVHFGGNRATLSGGALHTEAGSAVVAQGTRFLGNSAANGGAIAANGALEFTDVLIQNNMANGEGGGIQAYFNQTTLLRTTLDGNRARHGGGLLQRGGELEITDSEIVSNLATQFADGDGGGLHLQEGADFTGTNLRLAQNHAADLGGGIYLGGEVGGGAVPRSLGIAARLLNSRIEQNTAHNGGGVYVFGLPPTSGGRFAMLHVENTRLINNTAFLGGGVYSRGIFSAYRSVIENNVANSFAAGFGSGGGLFLETNFDDTSPFSPDQYTYLEDTQIRGNQAGHGGGLFASDHALYLAGSSFVQNVAENGGGAWVQGLNALLPMARAAFVRNRGSRGAGLALSLYQPMSLQFLTFSDNRLEQGSGVKGRDLWIQANGTVPMEVELRHVTAFNPDLRHGATVHAEAGVVVRYGNSILFGGSAFDGIASCAGAGSFATDGGNIVGIGCPFMPPQDVTHDSIAALALGALVEVGAAHYHLPLASSPVVDFSPCSLLPGPDQRGQPLNQDGNGDGVASCDAGAVERQPVEAEPILFRDGFEG